MHSSFYKAHQPASESASWRVARKSLAKTHDEKKTSRKIRIVLRGGGRASKQAADWLVDERNTPRRRRRRTPLELEEGHSVRYTHKHETIQALVVGSPSSYVVGSFPQAKANVEANVEHSQTTCKSFLSGEKQSKGKGNETRPPCIHIYSFNLFVPLLRFQLVCPTRCAVCLVYSRVFVAQRT